MKDLEESIEHLIYPGQLCLLQEVADAIDERIKLWSEKVPKIEWGCVLIGDYRAEGSSIFPLVTKFIELPAWNLNRENSLSINLNDILRIAEEHNILALLHSHPSGSIFPSAQDLASFVYCDILLGRPLLYIIATPNKEKLILSFEKCHSCENSFLKAIAMQSRVANQRRTGSGQTGRKPALLEEVM